MTVFKHRKGFGGVLIRPLLHVQGRLTRSNSLQEKAEECSVGWKEKLRERQDNQNYRPVNMDRGCCMSKTEFLVLPITSPDTLEGFPISVSNPNIYPVGQVKSPRDH